MTLYEADTRIGGHSHTVDAGVPVDTGFIVYNETTYPNLTALFSHLGVETKATEMTFAVSLDGGRLEYSGTGLGGLFAQRRNLVSPRFWSMMRDLVRFYRQAPKDLPTLGDEGLGAYLDRGGYGAAFRDDHLYPMAAAIWSTPAQDIPDYPAAAFIGFCDNHGLLNLGARPLWRTVEGGSRAYVKRITAPYAERIETGKPVRAIRRLARGGVEVDRGEAGVRRFDHVVIATHADQALSLIADADAHERSTLGAFGYRANDAVLHCDASLMPKRRAVWSSWNYASDARTERSNGTADLSVTYWMNRLQHIPDDNPLFVTLNPLHEPEPTKVIRRDRYEHPIFDAAASAAQARLWSLQGVRDTWFCGAYFGAGFHEDGLQAGLAVAEDLGGIKRPWTVAGDSGRIQRGPVPAAMLRKAAA